MTTNQFISVRETSQLLGISERKVMDLIEEKQLQAYKIADQFLRLKKSEVLDLRNTGTVVIENVQHPYTRPQRMKDFFYYNDFYILSAMVILGLLYVIFIIE